jgi:hypothetical protein
MPLPQLPDIVTPEQFERLAPAIVRYLLTTANGYTDGIDEISEYTIDGETISGTFIDRRSPAMGGDRVFSFEIWKEGGKWQRSYDMGKNAYNLRSS